VHIHLHGGGTLSISHAAPVLEPDVAPASHAQVHGSPVTPPSIVSTGSSATPPAAVAPPVFDVSPSATSFGSGTGSAGSSTLSAPILAPAAPLPIDSRRPVTRSLRGIHQRKQRTDGTIAWLANCLAEAVSDPHSEPRHFCAA
jgi:hypothetical protein